MKTLSYALLFFLSISCSDLNKNYTVLDYQAVPSRQKIKKPIIKNRKNNSKEISGTLSNGTLYEAMQDPEGYVVSFDPYLPKNDQLFMKATSQIIARIYNDKIKNEARISIQTDIGYTIIEGTHARYKIVPYKEESGDISTLSIMVI